MTTNKTSRSSTAKDTNNDNEAAVASLSGKSTTRQQQEQVQVQRGNQQLSNNNNTKCITKLPQHVVDMIAAGEVVQRPSAVIKELIENSLDAGSTKIIVDLEGNGCLDKITITDNGKGITKDDLKLAATRHATSKLNDVNDFQTLNTFGFRGEALASISFVCRKLTITTRTSAASTTTSSGESNSSSNVSSNNNIGYKQVYQNGKVYPNDNTKPKPCAKGTIGTTICIQDLFYNVPHRKQTVKLLLLLLLLFDFLIDRNCHGRRKGREEVSSFLFFASSSPCCLSRTKTSNQLLCLSSLSLSLFTFYPIVYETILR